jgi:hypothetical protein
MWSETLSIGRWFQQRAVELHIFGHFTLIEHDEGEVVLLAQVLDGGARGG